MLKSIYTPSSHLTSGNPKNTSKDIESIEVFYCKNPQYPKLLLFFFIGFILFNSSSCKEKISTPDWASSSNQTINHSENTTNAPEEIIPQIQHDPDIVIRFVCYNLRNYLTMRRGKEAKFKPEHEVKAVINNIIRANPDILGVCEIGNQTDLNHLQGQLKKAGCYLPHIYLSVGADPYRRQALLSRYPIQYHSVPNYTFRMKGKHHKVRRGILDATVQTPKGNVRFLGAHLKSKRPIAIYDQAEIRREEAQILRKHASSILSDHTQKLIVFGDMNDTKGSSTIRLMAGSNHGKLTTIELWDKYGTKWTQYWAKEDIYSRFDYIFASNSILPMIDQKNSYILETPLGDQASDHRALVIVIH